MIFFRSMLFGWIWVVMAGAAAAGAGVNSVSPPFRLMSFNVRTSTAADGPDAWPLRKNILIETIERFQPTLIGFQEVREDQHDEIIARMPDYAFSGVARDDGKRKGEWSLIGFRKERFSAQNHGDFWLSEQPEVPGSKSWDAALTRICSWVRLRETATGREYVFANTHFDHRGVIARREASRVLSEQLAKIAAGVPAILTGDLNIKEDNPAYAVLVQPTLPGAIRWIDSYREIYPQRATDEASFHGFKGTVAGSRIDFIFHTADFKATASAIDRFSKGGRYPSDHYAVTAILVIK
jgi:endonuclease/exonuclease/phosphatase family metal-dependent hydrolase